MANKFDQNRPYGGERIQVGDEALRENNRTLQASLELEHQPFDVSDEADGQHKLPRLTHAQAQALTGQPVGHIVFITDHACIGVYDGSRYIYLYAAPVGKIISMGNIALVPGYLPCDGAQVSKATYPDLWDYLGILWNEFAGQAPPSAGNFRVPLLEGYFMVGQGTIYYPLVGMSGGASDATTTKDATGVTVNPSTQTNPHAGLGTIADHPHDHGVTDPGHEHTIAENRPPYAVLSRHIKY